MELAKLVPKWQTSVSKSTVRTRQLELRNRGHRTSRRCVLLEIYIYIYIHSAMPGNWLESLWISTSYTLWVLNRIGFLCYFLWTCIFLGVQYTLLAAQNCLHEIRRASCLLGEFQPRHFSNSSSGNWLSKHVFLPSDNFHSLLWSVSSVSPFLEGKSSNNVWAMASIPSTFHSKL